MMIILFIAHIFRKDQTYASLFSSALKEGINDTFKEVGKEKKEPESQKLNAVENKI